MNSKQNLGTNSRKYAFKNNDDADKECLKCTLPECREHSNKCLRKLKLVELNNIEKKNERG